MEKLSDLLDNHNFSKDCIKDFSARDSKSETNAQSEENIIDNLISELSDIIPQPVSSNAIPSHSAIENQNKNLKLKDPPNLDEILEADEALIAPTSHNVSVLNAACQNLLNQIEQQLLALLKKNRREQEVIQAFFNANCKTFYCDNPKKISLKCAGMPYFKDSQGFLPPPNDDVLRKKRNKKLLPIDFIKSFPIWNSADAKNLMNAVKKYDTSNPSSIDWLKISVTDMEGKYSASECKSKWNMHLNPKINKSKWSSKEMELLKTLCAKYNYQDWDNIAAELGNNRTGLQCCTQYHTHTFPTEGKWTKEEDETLVQLVEKYRVRDYIPWTKVVWYFENRSLKQCQERYVYHLANITKGNFTMEEDFVIVYLASKLKNFGEVAKFLPKRVSTQVRSRYEYLVELSMPEFSKEEDELLTKLMAQYPRNWGKISENFKNRSRVQCRKRWAYLQKNIQLEGEVCSESDDNESLDSTSNSNTTKLKNSKIDTENVKKNYHLISKPSHSTKKYSEVYNKLIDYHKYCHKFLFGPKPRIPSNLEDLKNLSKKMIITMKILSVTHIGPLSGFNMSWLSNNCEFDKEDFDVLNKLKSDEQEIRSFQLSKKFIPPNYMTLVGLRTFTLAWNKIKSLCDFHKEASPLSPSTAKVCSEERLLCSDAKKLFKSRLKSIFAFPLIFSNITSEEKDKRIYKPKVRKAVKPMSKRKRKKHAKLMSAAYRNKMKSLCEQFQDTNDLLLDQNNDTNKKKTTKAKPVKHVSNAEKSTDSEKSCETRSKLRTKRLHSSAAECEEVVAPLKKRQLRKLDFC